MVDILAIKCKENAEKIDYKMNLKISKPVEYQWKVLDKLNMTRCQF